MSFANSLTHFPILTFTTKFNPINNSFSFHRRFSPLKFPLSDDLISGKFSISGRRIRRKMGEKVVKISALRSEDGEEDFSVFEQEAIVDDGSPKVRFNVVSPELEARLNRFSKWFVSISFGLILLLRHDAGAVWTAMGAVLNTVLSVALKRVLNQERPVGNLRADPGMPSSHAQSIFFIVTFIILTLVEWLGVNEVTAILAALSLAIASYLSWLRVAQKLHSIDQVVVGGVLGFCFSLAWWWSWEAVVLEAFNSELWVRVSIVLASAICCVAFVSYAIRNWLRDEKHLFRRYFFTEGKYLLRLKGRE